MHIKIKLSYSQVYLAPNYILGWNTYKILTEFNHFKNLSPF